jgi:hypothetical protein
MPTKTLKKILNKDAIKAASENSRIAAKNSRGTRVKNRTPLRQRRRRLPFLRKVKKLLGKYSLNLEAPFYSPSRDVLNPDVEDNIRGRTACYWTLDNEGNSIKFLRDVVEDYPLDYDFTQLEKAYTLVEPSASAQSDSQKLKQAICEDGVGDDDTHYEDFLPEDFDEVEEFFTVEPVDTHPAYNVKNPNKVFELMITGGIYARRKFEPGLFTGREYIDRAFFLPTPKTKKEIDMGSNTATSMYVDVRPTYNFYIKNYEKAIGLKKAKETLLPNMYVMLSDLLNEDSSNDPEGIENPWFEKLITLDGTIKNQSSCDLLLDRKDREVIDLQDNTGQYYDLWGRQFSLIPDQSLTQLQRKYSNLIVTHENVDLIKDYNAKKELFPMFVELEFSTSENVPLANMIEESGLSAFFMTQIIESIEGDSGSPLSFQRLVEKPLQYPNAKAGKETATKFKVQNENMQQEIRSIDIVQLLDDLYQNLALDDEGTVTDTDEDTKEISLAALEGPKSVILGKNSQALQSSNSVNYLFYQALTYAIFKAKLAEMAIEKMRTYQEIVGGQLCETETLLYRIEKRAGGENGEVIQNIYLPNSSKVDVHRYVDTQVKYGKRYTYKIYAYEVVYGTSYLYRDYWIENKTAGITTASKPNVQLVEIPYYTYTNILLDSPPVSPDVDIIPFRAVNNKVKFNFNSGVGRYEKKPNFIEQSEVLRNNILLAAQDKYIDEELRYESDDQAREYEVWRLEEYPENYQDFQGNKIYPPTPQPGQTPVSPDEQKYYSSVIDTIKPNKKYWYVFRGVDVHGNISDASPLFQVELVDENGAVFPQIKEVPFKSKIAKAPIKEGKRMLYIAPKFVHALLNEEKSMITPDTESVLNRWNSDDIFLGLADESVWGKQFKIRLTSKKTGKKIDIDVEFDHKHLKVIPPGINKKKPEL